MTTSVTLYQSTDSGAPSLSGTNLSLTSLLNSCLVAGYGSITGLGWTRPVLTGNGASFRAPSGGTQNYLQVYDNSQSSQSAREARIRAYETMSDLDTGTVPYPTVTQQPTGLVIRKSTSADSSTRPWRLIGNGNLFYLFTMTGDFSSRYCVTMFGDITSYKTGGDSYCGMLIARNGENATETTDAFYNLTSAPNLSANGGHFIDRSYTGIGSSVACSKIADYSKANQSVIGVGTTVLPYPNGPDGGLYMSRIWICHGGYIRGHLPGVWCPLHNLPLNDGDTFSGSGALAGRTFMAVSICGNSAAAQVFIETSNTWD